MLRFLLPALLAAGAAIAQPAPVDAPTGRLAGEIDGHAFDLPVICEDNEAGWLMVRSHRDIAFNTKPDEIAPALEIAVPGNMMAVTAWLGSEKYEFGARGVDTPRSMAFDSEIRSKDGNYPARFTLDCDGG